MKGGLLLMVALGVAGKPGGMPGGAEVPALRSVYASARAYDRAAFHYRAAPQTRIGGVRALVRELSAAARAGRALGNESAGAAKLGFELAEARDAAGAVWVLRERGERREGDGLYVFRPHGAALCVQAPHTFFDEGTGDIALALFAETRALALFVNTVHRYSPSPQGEDAADVAHADTSVFQGATEGLLAAARVAVVQVHGFGPRQPLGAEVSAVVSDGLERRLEGSPTPHFRAALQRSLPGRVLLFGVDTNELGATTNVQGRSVRHLGAVFLHVELSRDIRKSAEPPAHALTQALREVLPLVP